MEGIGDEACLSILSMSLTTRSFNRTSYADVSTDSFRNGGGVSGDLTVVVGSRNPPRADEPRVVAGFVKPACFVVDNLSSDSAMFFVEADESSFQRGRVKRSR